MKFEEKINMVEFKANFIAFLLTKFPKISKDVFELYSLSLNPKLEIRAMFAKAGSLVTP